MSDSTRPLSVEEAEWFKRYRRRHAVSLAAAGVYYASLGAIALVTGGPPDVGSPDTDGSPRPRRNARFLLGASRGPVVDREVSTFGPWRRILNKCPSGWLRVNERSLYFSPSAEDVRDFELLAAAIKRTATQPMSRGRSAWCVSTDDGDEIWLIVKDRDTDLAALAGLGAPPEVGADAEK